MDASERGSSNTGRISRSDRVSDYERCYPDLAEQIRDLLPALVDLEALRSEELNRTATAPPVLAYDLRQAGTIVVLERGSIVEHGSHEELVEAGGYYAELCRKQMLEEELEAI